MKCFLFFISFLKGKTHLQFLECSEENETNVSIALEMITAGAFYSMVDGVSDYVAWYCCIC